MADRLPDKPSRPGHLHALDEHLADVRQIHLRDLFAEDPERGPRYSISLGELQVDYSKHRFAPRTMELLIACAEGMDLRSRIHDLLSGAEMNGTEGRPALHTALRASEQAEINVEGENVVALVHHELQRVYAFARQINDGRLFGASGRPITTLVHIGIGGSDLGPRLAVEALYEHSVSDVRIAFVSNIDDQDLFRTLRSCDPHTTFFSVASKSFGTLETRKNALSALRWLSETGCPEPARQLAAITARPDAAAKLGIPVERIFKIWDWVGGRYSLWSAMGLPLAVSIGPDGFEEMLAGARAVDEHFGGVPLHANVPVVLGLLDVWYTGWLGAETLGIVPYDERLRLLPEYLSQLVMESNGKRVARDGAATVAKSAPIVWGSVGTNAQHAFFQLLHQGTHLVPLDFLAGLRASYDVDHHRELLANCLAQSEALMLGRNVPSEPYRDCPGNQPSTTFLYQDLTPRMLGMLLALYEHRTFVQSVIWNINAFDQWGVELGKELAKGIARELAGEARGRHDSSTTALLELCLRHTARNRDADS